ncbi:MAG TPA: transglutaminase domain-containing protein [Candidatus Sulfotelmatobacter sp.]|nr:transglutaminase domain-containing protein [Candidatus Sulfotelmatobacter sp.]
MQSVSPSGSGLARPSLLERTRGSIAGAQVWSAILVLLLTLTVARSTATADWVDGTSVIPLIALAAAVLFSLLAVLPTPGPAALGAGVVLGIVVAGIAAGPQIHLRHPTDVVSLQLPAIWWERIRDGSATYDPSVYLYLISFLMWVTGGWLAWCVLRWRKPLLGLIPGAAAFATNLLNIPADQNGYTLAMLVLTLALLLWSNYSGSISNATRANVKLTGDARWDFWESGLVAMAALIVLGIMLPPFSTIDRTVDVESSLFSNWAQLQQRLSHVGAFTNGPGSAGTTGFYQDVPLNGPLLQTRDVVFTYPTSGPYAGPRYFRGVNVTVTQGREWRYAGLDGQAFAVRKNQVPPYGEDYLKLAYAGFDIRMLNPPIDNADILFYPDELYKIDRQAQALQVPLRVSTFGELDSIDRLSATSPPRSNGLYKLQIEYSTATVDDLRGAGTAYRDWVLQFAVLPPSGYRAPDVLTRIGILAQQIVDAAGATTPYDKASAIEAYLRDPNRYTYTLNPPTPPTGTDPLDYFLFTSKRGDCQYFASAMGDMLRSLGIPTRLVNGSGPGEFDQATQSYVVRGEDAHTWVESYFPAYGWISFEPTPQAGYSTIARGTSGTNPCLRDNGCDLSTAGSGAGTVGLPGDPGRRGGNQDPGAAAAGGSQFNLKSLDAGTVTKIAGVLLALVLLLFAAVTRYLRPRTVMAVWKRTLALASLAGAERRPGETPYELSKRLQRTFPEASEPVGALATGFVVAAYAPPDEASSSRASVMEAWSALRPMLLRRVFARMRPVRA